MVQSDTVVSDIFLLHLCYCIWLGHIQDVLLLWDWMGLCVLGFELLYFPQHLKYTFFFIFLFFFFLHLKAVTLTVNVHSNG